MTGSAEDGPDWQRHICNKEKGRDLANRFKNPKDPFNIVIVRDMWLTGFDAPCLHTMYADKPMQGHGLMQAIARVYRVFKDKPGGLIVDYLGLADQLKRALATYTESGGQGNPTYDTKQAIAVMLEKHGIAGDMLHGFGWKMWTTGTPTERLQLIPAGQEHILDQEDGTKRWVQVVTELSRALMNAPRSPFRLPAGSRSRRSARPRRSGRPCPFPGAGWPGSGGCCGIPAVPPPMAGRRWWWRRSRPRSHTSRKLPRSVNAEPGYRPRSTASPCPRAARKTAARLDHIPIGSRSYPVSIIQHI
jgi:hypothetical protein